MNGLWMSLINWCLINCHGIFIIIIIIIIIIICFFKRLRAQTLQAKNC